ncbi:hypothetical protein FIBSPDRAFT_1038093 [Athelia psychrophila]|uniref:F-box domain-containing protein n=1 Tax=Athelia psychrophila TaxID=1759441 RepID=A0A166TQ33_9AGAM|nr:hypothetical protein FIBSPDRAFT_1038093 [Fibularhizoctonia sp. CBS 109695]
MPIFLAPFSRQAVPLLRSVRLIPHYVMKFQQPFLSLGAPRLTTVELDGMDPLSFHFCIPAFASVTFLQLNSLHIHDQQQYDSFRDGLMNMAALDHLELRLYALNEPVQPIVLPNLRSLAVDLELNSSSLSIIIKCILAPSLVSLSLTAWDPDEDHLDYLVLGETYFPALQHLILGSSVMNAFPDFELLAKAFPNIERFTCRVERPEQAEIGSIIANITDPGDQLRWPKLRSIAISTVYRTLDTDQVDGLCQLIIELQQAGRPFRQLSYSSSESCIALAGAGGIHKLGELVELEDFRDDWPTPFEWPIWEAPA